MDSDKFKEVLEQIKKFIKKSYKFIKNNKLVVYLIILIIVIIVVTYLFSEKYRTKSKVSNVLNSLLYDEPRKQIDFCGLDNNVPDTIYIKEAEIDVENNTIKITNPDTINLFDLGLSSEYMIHIKDSENTSQNDLSYDGIYKLSRVLSSSELELDASTQISGKDKTQTNITQQINDTYKTYSANNFNSKKEKVSFTLTYYRPTRKVNIYKFKPLSDYYIASSHRSFLVGKQKVDYCSLDMINRVLFLGARYIELEIFND